MSNNQGLSSNNHFFNVNIVKNIQLLPITIETFI
jgi:hypothetical protein